MIFLACMILVPLMIPQLGHSQAVGGIVDFTRTPSSYNPETGSFTLDQTVYMGGNVGGLCLRYESFHFNATAGLALHGLLESPGQNIYYIFLNSSQFRVFEDYAENCYLVGSGQMGVFNSQSTLDWVAPVDGQYAIVFFTRTNYSGPVYFKQ